MNIVISGTVGVGKSSVSNKLNLKLKEKYNNVILNEEIEEFDPILDEYYKDRPSWSFLIQVKFVLDRFKKTYANSSYDNINIFDRHFLDDFIIASMPFIRDDMSNMLWESYHFINNELTNKLKYTSKVDYFFLLKADFNEIINRVNSRGRESEKNVDIKYWRSMYDHYYNNILINSYIKNNVENFILVDTNDKSLDELVSNILKKIDL